MMLCAERTAASSTGPSTTRGHEVLCLVRQLPDLLVRSLCSLRCDLRGAAFYLQIYARKEFLTCFTC